MVIFLVSCAEKKEDIDYSKLDPEILFTEAESLYNQENYTESASKFMTISEEYPFSDTAVDSLFMALKSYYSALKFTDAEVVANEFIYLYPVSKKIEEVYYLKALIFYDQIKVVKLDQGNTLMAKEAIEEYLNRYPSGQYSNDLKLKMDLVTEHFAGKEMEVGRYYLTQNDYVAAINRFEIVVEKYQTTNHIEEALYRLTESYYALGITKEAKKYAAILGRNYPTSDWYLKAYNLLKS
jgi:outer membrane protein assembly factor BamD